MICEKVCSLHIVKTFVHDRNEPKVNEAITVLKTVEDGTNSFEKSAWVCSLGDASTKVKDLNKKVTSVDKALKLQMTQVDAYLVSKKGGDKKEEEKKK